MLLIILVLTLVAVLSGCAEAAYFYRYHSSNPTFREFTSDGAPFFSDFEENDFVDWKFCLESDREADDTLAVLLVCDDENGFWDNPDYTFKMGRNRKYGGNNCHYISKNLPSFGDSVDHQCYLKAGDDTSVIFEIENDADLFSGLGF